MAAKTPVTKGSAGFLPADAIGIPSSSGALAPPVRDGTAKLAGLREEQFSFSDLDDGDTWASGIPGIVAVYWNGDSSTDQADAFCSDRSTGTITFNVASANTSGYILVLSRG